VSRGGAVRHTRAIALAVAVGAVVAGILASLSGPGRHAAPPVREPQAVWAHAGARPLSDAAAAALVTPEPELRRGNAAADDYVPTTAQLRAFYTARDPSGRTRLQVSRLFGLVTGRPGLAHPSTGELIQWAAHKWGIPEGVLRAQVQVESTTAMGRLGDRTAVSRAVYSRYPPQARIAGGATEVYESMGLTQVKWTPDGRVGAGTEPLRWRSAAFDLDLLGATLRYYYDGECGWCRPGYGAGRAWASVGAWYSPNPWDNAGARRYVQLVKDALRQRSWEPARPRGRSRSGRLRTGRRRATPQPGSAAASR
jgi:hypothetical protein